MAASEQIAEVINFKHTDPNPQPNNGDLWREGSQLKYHNGTTTVDLANPSTMTLVEGDGITIDATDPDAPVISLTDFANLDGLTSNVQTQLDAKANAASVPSVADKSSSTSRNTTTTFADDPHLTLPVVANGVYLIEAWIEWTAGAGGVKFQFSLPSGATFLVWRALAGSSPSASTNGILLNDTNAGTFAMRLTGLIRIASTAGNCALRWAQSTSNGANTTLNSGSTITLRKTA